MKQLEIIKKLTHSLANSTPHKRRTILKRVSNSELKSLCGLCLNVTRGKFPVDKNALKRLKRHRKTLETLADRRVSLQKKRDVINQKGGFIGPLVAFALPLLTQLIASQISKRIK